MKNFMISKNDHIAKKLVNEKKKIALLHSFGQNLGKNKLSWWRRKWQPSPVFLPGESHGQKSLAGYSPQGRKKSDMSEAT